MQDKNVILSNLNNLDTILIIAIQRFWIYYFWSCHTYRSVQVRRFRNLGTYWQSKIHSTRAILEGNCVMIFLSCFYVERMRAETIKLGFCYTDSPYILCKTHVRSIMVCAKNIITSELTYFHHKQPQATYELATETTFKPFL